MVFIKIICKFNRQSRHDLLSRIQTMIVKYVILITVKKITLAKKKRKLRRRFRIESIYNNFEVKCINIIYSFYYNPQVIYTTLYNFMT